MAGRWRAEQTWPQAERGDPPGRRLGTVAGAVSGVFAVAAVALVVLAVVAGTTVETTVYSAVAALLFALLAIGAVRERAEARRRSAERSPRDGRN